jgi:glutamate synthase (NADPH/NADH) small chain
MGKTTGFLEIDRQVPRYAPIETRIKHFNEFSIDLNETELKDQGARCMDCGIPFCHSGCPVNNSIPDWNDLVYKGDWREALTTLHSTNNFPEFTGKICPAPCEESCVLNLEDTPVAIKTIESAIIEKAWQEGWIQPQPCEYKTDKTVAIVGSGPAGLAAAQQLARAGHTVTVFERQERAGGLLRFGIPDFKLEKKIIDRRISQMLAEGVKFKTNTHVGVDISAQALMDKYDAVVLTGGSEQPRDLPLANRDLDGIHFAMDFLRNNTRRVQGLAKADEAVISAQGKHVVVIGGGDTGSDCIGTSARHHAASITQLEIMPRPPEKEDKLRVWPEWANKMRTSSSQQEGCERLFSVATKEFVGENGKVSAIKCIEVQWTQNQSGQWKMNEVAGSEFELKADLIMLAMGFVHPVHEGMLDELGVAYDAANNVAASTEGEKAYHSSIDKIFTAGDMRRGQSLVVWAIREGRQCAHSVDAYLMGQSDLPR